MLAFNAVVEFEFCDAKAHYFMCMFFIKWWILEAVPVSVSVSVSVSKWYLERATEEGEWSNRSF